MLRAGVHCIQERKKRAHCNAGGVLLNTGEVEGREGRAAPARRGEVALH